ncbi:MAG: hypothetical protein ABEJ36_02960 [Candidatus Nanosalina sp.]
MGEDTVRVDTEWDEEKFEELQEFIDDHKDSRRSGKKFYSQRILNMAHKYMQDFKEEEKEIEDTIKE